MNSNNDFLNMVKERSAEGNIFFRPILMQFAAHHIGRSYSDFYLDHEILVAANIACMEAFGMDACGNITHLLPHLCELKPDIVDCDWMVDMDHAYEILGSDIIRAGNLDPVAVVERLSAEAVYDKTKSLVAGERGRPFILSGGCEITPMTPPENLMAMRTASHS